ncbi:ferredoxin [Candidatus Woesearchaeota archaeon]|nr:ferredoxin [Candidatus Woesearchaeota archaeon]
MAKYKIIYDREACIGALGCIGVSEDLWILREDGKVDLKGAIFNKKTQKWELIIYDEDIAFASEDSCPVQAIKIEKIED